MYLLNTEKYKFLKSAFMKMIPELRDGYQLTYGDDFRPNHYDRVYFGSRFMSDDRIWAEIVGTLGEEDREIEFHEAIGAKLSEDEMVERVNRALDYAASTDYYYKFEKEY